MSLSRRRRIVASRHMLAEGQDAAKQQQWTALNASASGKRRHTKCASTTSSFVSSNVNLGRCSVQFEVATGEGFQVAAGVFGRAGQGEWKRSG